MIGKSVICSAGRLSRLSFRHQRCMAAKSASVLVTQQQGVGETGHLNVASKRPISSLALRAWDMVRAASFNPPNPILQENIDFTAVHPHHLVAAAEGVKAKYKSDLQVLEETLLNDSGTASEEFLLEELENLEAPLDFIHNFAALYRNLIQIPSWEAAAYEVNSILDEKPHERSHLIAEALARFDREYFEEDASASALAIRYHLNNYRHRGVFDGKDSSLEALRGSLDEIEARFVKDTEMSSRTSTRKKLEDIYGMISLKKKCANLCGYDNYVDYVLAAENRLAKSKDEITSLHNLVKAKFSDASTRPFIKYEDTQRYLSLDGVLLGIFGLARALFGIVFNEVDSPHGWTPDVRLFTAVDEISGQELGNLYLDPFFRGTKLRNFFVSPLSRDSVFLGAPIQAAAWKNEPTPLKFQDALSLVHEFGHVLHFILAKNHPVATHHMPKEISEVMPQLMEHFLFEEPVLQTLAHVSGSQPFPRELIAKLREQRVAEKVHVMNQRAFLGQFELELFSDLDESVVSLQRRLAQEYVPQDLPDKNDLAALFKIMHDNASDRNICRYRYLYGEVMSANIFSLIQEAGIENREEMRELGTRLRKALLEPGGLVNGSAFVKLMCCEISPDALFNMYASENADTE